VQTIESRAIPTQAGQAESFEGCLPELGAKSFVRRSLRARAYGYGYGCGDLWGLAWTYAAAAVAAVAAAAAAMLRRRRRRKVNVLSNQRSGLKLPGQQIQRRQTTMTTAMFSQKRLCNTYGEA